MLLLLFFCCGQPLEPTTVEQQPPPGQELEQESSSSAALQRLNEVMQQSPEAASIMRKAATDVASRPFARQAISTLISLMQTTHGTDVVMNSLQELMQGAHDGPGLRSLAQALGLDHSQFSQAALAMQAIPPYGSQGAAAVSLPQQLDGGPGAPAGLEAVMNGLQQPDGGAPALLNAAPGWGVDATDATQAAGGGAMDDVINSGG